MFLWEVLLHYPLGDLSPKEGCPVVEFVEGGFFVIFWGVYYIPEVGVEWGGE